jgi:hypothetical protein
MQPSGRPTASPSRRRPGPSTAPTAPPKAVATATASPSSAAAGANAAPAATATESPTAKPKPTTAAPSSTAAPTADPLATTAAQYPELTYVLVGISGGLAALVCCFCGAVFYQRLARRGNLGQRDGKDSSTVFVDVVVSKVHGCRSRE